MQIRSALGHPTLTPEETQRVTLALVNWRASRSRFSTNFKSARVVLSYKVDSQKQAAVLKKHSLTEAIALNPEEISVPATILAIGESLPGKDFAVLRGVFEPEWRQWWPSARYGGPGHWLERGSGNGISECPSSGCAH